MSYFLNKNVEMPRPEKALPHRDESMTIEPLHYVSGRSMLPPYPVDMKRVVLGLGCFWGAERAFWSIDGVYSTSVGYAGGFTRNPLYKEVCSGMTGHTEVVHVVYDPSIVTLVEILKTFWEKHDPTQGMRQGNDLGTQYRSAIYYLEDEDLGVIEASLRVYQSALKSAGQGEITTEIAPLNEYFYAESYHQQYLAKNPDGYCGLGGTGVSCQTVG